MKPQCTMILSTLTALFFLSCAKKEKDSFGPEVASEDIQAALDKALGHQNPYNLEVGEFVYTIRTQEVYAGDNPNRLLLEEEGITVTDREVDGDILILGVVRELVDHSDPSTPHNKFKDVYYLDNLDAPSPDVIAAKALVLFEDATGPDDGGGDSVLEAPISYTYHNFSSQEERVPRPTKVADREPCPQEQNCSLRATRIFYDGVVRQEGQPTRKMQFEFLITGDTPYFGNFLKNCVTTLASVEDARPLVRQCNSVYDYLQPSKQQSGRKRTQDLVPQGEQK